MQRQVALLAIADELKKRGARVDRTVIDVTAVFSGTKSSILKKAKSILAVRLCGFAELLGREIQPGRRLGSEISDYAKKCGVGGIFHTDELPAYGVTEEEVARLREAAGAADEDCVAIVAAGRERAGCAAEQVMVRAEMALSGVPEETRKMLDEGSSAYMRPLPGAARMYPETDLLPVVIDEALLERITVPELLTDRAKRFTKDLGLDEDLARQMAFSERLPTFEAAVAAGVRPTIAARTLLATCRELARDGVAIDRVSEDEILALLSAVEEGRAAKEAIPDLLTELARTSGEELGTADDRVNAAIAKVAPAASQADVEAVVRRIVAEREAFARERGMGALGPLMGVVMQELRGSVDGKVVSETLRRELQRLLS